ncbi:MAG: hypothetical protein ABIJ09_08145 [Pseudomonadota bacterium]
MRIGRSSGPVRGSRSEGAQKTKGSKGPGFARMVERVGTAESTEAMARNVRSALLEELMGVAKELAEAGDKQDSTKRFVSAVVRDRFKNLKGKDAKHVEEAVSDLINRDEALAQRLQSQLARPAKS